MQLNTTERVYNPSPRLEGNKILFVRLKRGLDESILPSALDWLDQACNGLLTQSDYYLEHFSSSQEERERWESFCVIPERGAFKQVFVYWERVRSEDWRYLKSFPEDDHSFYYWGAFSDAELRRLRERFPRLKLWNQKDSF